MEKKRKGFFRKLFDIYNDGNRKVIRLFGLKIKFRSKYLALRNRMQQMEQEMLAMHQAHAALAAGQKEQVVMQQAFNRNTLSSITRLEQVVARVSKAEAAVREHERLLNDIRRRLTIATEGLRKAKEKIANHYSMIGKTQESARKTGESIRELTRDIRRLGVALSKCEKANKTAVDALRLAKSLNERSKRWQSENVKQRYAIKHALEAKINKHVERIKVWQGERVRQSYAMKQELDNKISQQAELRDSIRLHYLRTNFLGDEHEDWERAYQRIIITKYRSLEFSQKDSQRVIVYMPNHTTQPGLADRLRTMITAYVLAAESGRRLYIYHDKGFKLEEYLLPNKVDWRIAPEDISMGLNKVSFRFFITRFEDLSRDDRECHIYASLNSVDSDFLPEHLMGKYTDHTVFHELFRFSPEIQQNAQEIMERHALTENEYVSVHIRFLNFFEPVEVKGTVTSTEQERSAMMERVHATIEKIHNKTGKPIVLFSDSNTFIQAPHPSFVTVIPGIVGHISKYNGQADITRKTFLDLLIMSRSSEVYSIIGEHIYDATTGKNGGLKNGFSRTAAFIGNKPFFREQLLSSPAVTSGECDMSQQLGS